MCIRDRVSSVKPARIEFCENKSIGGITPDLRLIESAVSSGIPIFPIIRPRGGNFVYSKKEIDQMINTVKICKEKKCHGVVFGVLDKNFSVDEASKRFVVQVTDKNTGELIRKLPGDAVLRIALQL